MRSIPGVNMPLVEQRMTKSCVAYYVEMDEIDPELADLPIDLLHDY